MERIRGWKREWRGHAALRAYHIRDNGGLVAISHGGPAMPAVAAGMNAMLKIVFSRTLESADWNNTVLVKSDPVETVRRMKCETGPDMTILGSGSIVTQLAAACLIDRFQIVVNPIALGAGKSLFSGLTPQLGFALTQTRVFANGSLVLWYTPRS